MKTFLKRLKQELTKLNFKPEEIKEIISDHEEMIEAAQKDGITDEELTTKFGDPEQLAKDLYENLVETNNPTNEGGTKVDGYELLTQFPVVNKEFNVKIAVVSEDVKYELHDEDRIEVWQKNIDEDKFEITFDGELFLIKRKSEINVLRIRKQAGKFIIKVPVGIQSKTFDVHVVSGDVKAQAIQSDALTIKTTSGDVKARDFKVKDLTVSTVSGDVTVDSGTADEATVSMVSGDFKAREVTVTNDVTMNTVSGDFKAENTYFGPFDFKTVSGDCKGTEFYPKTITFKSVSGDMKIENLDQSFPINVVSKKSLSGKVKIK